MFRSFPLYLFFLIGLVQSQELPPIKNFSPITYNAENQNWGISQSEDRLLYVANNTGLLEYNGANWSLFPSPNETIIRSVKVVGERIYTGCYREFGYWVKNVFGTLDYTSLSDRIKDQLLEDEEFWSITYVEGKVFFQSKKRIYGYDITAKSFEFISVETSLPRIFNTDSGIFVQETNEGLYRIVGGEKKIVNSDKVLREDEIINVFSKKGELLILTRNQGFFVLDEGTLQKWNIGADSQLQENSIYSAIQLKDKRFALGTVSNGLLLLDAEGNIQSSINQIKGLRNNTVLSLFEDFDGNIWLGLDNGVSVVNLKSPYKVYDDAEGSIGSVYAAIRRGDNLYLGTNQGLYLRKMNANGTFRLVPGTEGQVWSLDLIGNTLFCGHHSGTYIVSDAKAQKIVDVPGTWKIERIQHRSDLLLQGNYDGLYVLENKGGVWKRRNKIKGFNSSSRYFEIFGDRIFVNHEYKGVFEIKIDSSFAQAFDIKIDSLEPGFNSSIAQFGGELFYGHKLGVLKFNDEEGQFVTDSTLSKIYSEGGYVSGKIVTDQENGSLWFFAKEFMSRVFRGKLNESFVRSNLPIDKDTRGAIDGYESISYLDDGQYLLGTSTGYITVDLREVREREFDVQIQSINQVSKTQSGLLENFVTKNQEQEFAHDTNSLRFSFYSTGYEKLNRPKYQFQLLGIYPEWSEWSETAAVTFENLPHGEYTFNVRSLIGNELSNNIATFSFTIERPWYLSNLAIMVYALLLVLGSFLIHSAYRKYYRTRQEKLIAKNQREMALTKAQNEKEIIKIKNEQLQKEFRSKSNELAASTLSIIKKNELLTQVKEELMSNRESRDFTKPLVDIIDKSLKKNDDWELFKEAFNNADRKFMKKLKKAHPQLTPNDIKLCAYLRLNLSSKEIAPLFNISPRSVEIKRYRLRKKMNLSHDDSLTDYILKL